MSDDLAHLSIAEASALIRERKLSPLELTDACLARIEAVDGSLNAFITVTAEEARKTARELGEEIATGRNRGALHGIPIGLKDIFDVAGVRMTAASPILAENVATADSGVTRRLKDAGAVLVGKLNLHQFAFGATGRSSHFGPARNPWDAERITGGSSSGSGAAVAAGECFAAMGTDTGGSIRIPASLCGVTGLKPTFGRVTKAGLMPLSWSLDHAGPLTRTAEDAAIVLQAIAGHDPDDIASSSEPVPDYRAHLRDGVKGLRIGVPDSFFFDALAPEIDAGVREAIGVLEKLGARVEPVHLPLIAEIPAATNAIQLPEALAFHQKWMAERPDDYADDVRYRLELGAMMPAVSYVQAQRLREQAVTAWRDEVFSRVDVVATASTQTAAFKLDGSDLSVTLSLIRLTNPLNLLGVPAMSVPCGFTGDGLPFGLQLIGRWWDEATVLRAANAYQQATDWHTRRPPL
jgi:aspartyl-tRNA(Asn)/glutamyl-tRNA(Gln) amidotransferase subunit A